MSGECKRMQLFRSIKSCLKCWYFLESILFQALAISSLNNTVKCILNHYTPSQIPIRAYMWNNYNLLKEATLLSNLLEDLFLLEQDQIEVNRKTKKQAFA